MQTQTSNTLHNAIMEAGGKDRLPMLAPDKVVPVSKGSPETTTERYMVTYKNVAQDIRDQLNAKAEVVQIILTGIDNDIYSTVDACPNACEMWKAIKRLKHVLGKCEHGEEGLPNGFWKDLIWKKRRKTWVLNWAGTLCIEQWFERGWWQDIREVGEGVGIVPVSCKCTGCSMGKVGFLAGKWVGGTV
uniref:Uncharacterized protein n=1 Tax=Tanacetum cinerariifolium TaxID=118510 RepID=A0A699GIL8_TANCI|nr:hypothetical protein [Tanacetum cinerariifolium]